MAKPKKPTAPPPLPGQHCPDCGEETRQPEQDSYTWEEVRHENPRHCVQFLKRQLELLKTDLQEALGDIRDLIHAPRKY